MEVNHEKVKHLATVHRNLQHHWGVREYANLDATSSDRDYKRHLTRLKDIYTDEKPSTRIEFNSSHIIMPNKKPVTQLYGINGASVTSRNIRCNNIFIGYITL